MLNQPVPNPLAKNPNVHTHKVFATVGLILIGTIIAVAGIWWYLQNQGVYETTNDNSTNKISTSSANSTKKSETVSFQIFSNPEAGYSLQYPKQWLIRSYLDGDLCNVDHTFISPEDFALGVCSSGVGGVISITRTSSGANLDSVFPNYQDHNFKNREDKDLSLDGKNAKRISGTSQLISEIDDFREHFFIIYLVELGDRTLIIQYNQAPDFGDYSKEFEQIVESIKFN